MERTDARWLRSLTPTACGTVYPRSIAEGVQEGDILPHGDAVLFWHRCGFAQLFGDVDAACLAWVRETFLHADDLPRRFVLFTDDAAVTAFFRDTEGITTGTRLSFVWPEDVPPPQYELPPGYTLSPLDRTCLVQMQGRITPRFSWDDAAFLEKGSGVCVLWEGRPAAWAFSAAVSADEIDIGIETSPDHRHRGLGRCAAAAMVKTCLAVGKRPVWSCDAANTASCALAQSLGFVPTSTYTTIRKVRSSCHPSSRSAISPKNSRSSSAARD